MQNHFQYKSSFIYICTEDDFAIKSKILLNFTISYLFTWILGYYKMYLFGLPFVLFTLKWSTGKVFWQHTTWVQSLYYVTLLGWAVLRRSRLGLNMIIIITITKMIMTATILLESLRTKGLSQFSILLHAYHIETTHLFSRAKQMTGFYMTCNKD